MPARRRHGVTKNVPADLARPWQGHCTCRFPEVNNMELTWWESMGDRGGRPVDRLNGLMHEGRVRRVVVEDRGQPIAVFPVTATDAPTACAVLEAISKLTAAVADCRIKAELADLEAARVAAAQTLTP